MASLKHIKAKIVSVRKTSAVTRAMEAVSAVKMRTAQERALGTRVYASAALAILSRLFGTINARRHPLMRTRDDSDKAGKLCLIIITSDKGLAGALNSAVVRLAEREIASRGYAIQDVVVIADGRRGAEYFAARGYDVRLRRENRSDSAGMEEMREIVDFALSLHEREEINACIVAYTNFYSTFEQRPVVRQIIPILPDVIAEMVGEIVPVRGKYAGLTASEIVAPAAYTIEPDPEAVLRELVPDLLNIAVFHALLESKASEHSARMVAMKSATDKAKDMTRSLTRTFNKVRQAAITREISEITSGMEAMR